MPIGMRTRSTPRKKRRLGVEPVRSSRRLRVVSESLCRHEHVLRGFGSKPWNWSIGTYGASGSLHAAVIVSSSISFSLGWWLSSLRRHAVCRLAAERWTE